MDDYLSAAIRIVMAQAKVRVMSEDEMASMVKKLAASIRCLGESSDAAEESQIDASTVKNSIREKSVTCLVCGSVFKILSARHLASHGLTPEEYKEKFGMKPKTPLVAKSLQRMRKKKMQDMRLWEKRTQAKTAAKTKKVKEA
ncbi:MAG: MucR family transcriptional regulator [Desulfovibrio sp.]|jgi:predicted transcriptional regulator|nr:MucR family transcriptional regulator [Desulfovibrio sp.]